MTDGTFMGSDAGIPIIKPCIPRTNNAGQLMSKAALIKLAETGQKGEVAAAFALHQSKTGNIPHNASSWVHYRWNIGVSQLLREHGVSRAGVYRLDSVEGIDTHANQPVIGGKCNDCT